MSGTDPAFARKGLVLTLPKELSAVEEGRLAMLEYLQPLALHAKVINRVEVILEELVSNVVRHSDDATHVLLSINPCEEGLRLCVEDDGAAFNPLMADENAPFDKLEDAELGGLGIPLVKRLSHSIEYRRAGSTNQVCAVVAA